MFTGLIQAKGIVRSRAAKPDQAGDLLVIEPITPWPEGAAVRLGDSICISGVCLTIATSPAGGGASVGNVGGVGGVAGGGAAMTFDVHTETLAKTVLGSLSPGSEVNLEAAATMATALGGHVVQGHVEGTAVVGKVQTAPDWRITFAPDKALMECIVPKGSICVDGVSLTVASVDMAAKTFDVALIPTTLDKTTLGRLKEGERVNIETDIMARTVVHFLKHYMAGGGAGASSGGGGGVGGGGGSST